MLHEILFAVSGNSGGLLDQQIPFLHKSETDSLHKFSKLASLCILLSNIDLEVTKSASNILIFEKILNLYFQKIVDIEKRILDDDDIKMSLSLVLCEIDDYARIFKMILKITEIKNQKSSDGAEEDCNLLDILHDELIHCGDPICFDFLKGLIKYL
jgi:hypothetical protein